MTVHGTGGWGIGASSATVTVGGPEPEIAIPDPEEPAGDQEPPTWPEADFTGGGRAPIRHVSETMPAAPVVDGRVDMDAWQPTARTEAPWAYRRLIIEGQDVTTYLDLEVGSFAYTRSQPYGPRSARIDLPQITPWRNVPSWAKAGANVSIQYLTIGTNQVLSAWEGVVTGTSVNDKTGKWGLDCTGVMFCSDFQLRKPTPMTAPQDIGGLIPSLVNGAVARRTEPMAKLVTGIKRSVSGGWEPVLTGFTQQLLATALKDGRQWTVDCEVRTPVLRRKDITTVDIDVRFGQRGIVFDLTRDSTDAVNAIYGEGISTNGGRWANWKYPNWKSDDTPLYPLAPSVVFKIGLKDSQTNSGRGVSDAQAKLGRPVTGTWNRGDVTTLRRAQERAGITVDGVLGPQSWAAIFDTGANTGSLNGAFIAPLAVSSKVQPYRYGPDGDKLGTNPNFNPNILRIEDKIDFGEGYSKADARPIAREMLARSTAAGWVGTVTFTMDPPQKSRFRIVEDDNIRARDVHGQDLMLHVAQVDVANETVRVTVDSKARDYPTVQSIINANRNATDPAKAAVRRLVQGKVATDRATYDAESPGGRMPRHAVNGGYWDVRRIPLGAFGSVVRTSWYTDNPTKFCLAVFGTKITANKLLSVVGNPLTATDNPWEDDDLDKLGMLMAWGWKEQPLGYWPKTYSKPSGTTSASVTGRFVDDASWEWASASSPWVWVAMMTANDCYAWGRFYGRSGAW